MKKSEITKEKIIKVAIEIISRKGYSSTTTKEICNVAGLSEAILFKYFNTKEELLNKVIESIALDLKKRTLEYCLPNLLKETNSQKADILLRKIFNERCQFFKENSNTIKLILHEMVINKKIQQLFVKEIWDDMRITISEILNLGKIQNIFRDDIDNDIVVKSVIGLLLSLIYFDEILDIDKALSTDLQIEILLNGIRRN